MVGTISPFCIGLAVVAFSSFSGIFEFILLQWIRNVHHFFKQTKKVIIRQHMSWKSLDFKHVCFFFCNVEK